MDQLWKLLAAPPPSPRPPSRGWPACRTPGRLLDHVAARWRRAQHDAATIRCNRSSCGRCCCRPRAKAVSKPNLNELAEMWRAAASLERVDVQGRRKPLGAALVKQVRRRPAPTYGFWALTRLGAAPAVLWSAQRGLASETVGPWIDVLSVRSGQRKQEQGLGVLPGPAGPPDGTACSGYRRRPSDRGAGGAQGIEGPGAWPRMVEEGSPEGAEQGQLLGDSLPIGLRLASGNA